MKSIIPIAGKEYFGDNFCKGLLETDNGPLLYSVLKSRPWIKYLDELIFVSLDSYISRNFFCNHVKSWFPNSHIIYLSKGTSGAAFSMLAGLSIASDRNNEPIIVDLADIYFETNFIPYQENEKCGYAFAFKSREKDYSYFKLDKSMKVIKVAEKEQISNYASAGVYTFPSCSILLKALAYAIENPRYTTYKDLFYVAPIMNYLIKKNNDITLIKVDNFIDYKV